jgi:hypothetical protein
MRILKFKKKLRIKNLTIDHKKERINQTNTEINANKNKLQDSL